MQITVCIAVTPSTETKVVIADGGGIDPTDVKFETGPYDEFAVEEAIALKEKLGEGEVEVVTVGDGSQTEALRRCLAQGADRAVVLKTDIAGCDSAAIAGALVERIKSTGSGVAFFGKQAVDGDSSQVPAHVAALLDWPVATKISKLEIDGDAWTAHREIEGGVEVIEGKLPAVFSAEKGLNAPRLPKLKGIMAAKKKPLEEIEVTLEAARLVTGPLESPPARPEGRIIGEGAGVVDDLVNLLRNEAKVL